MDSPDTDSLQAVLMLLRDAGVSRFSGYGLTIEFSSTVEAPDVGYTKTDAPVVVPLSVPAEGERDGYEKLFNGNRPTFKTAPKE
jgi:hypothetical protein